MIAEMTLIPGAVFKIFEDLVSKVISDDVDYSKNAMKDIDQNRKSYNQNLQIQVYHVIMDSLNVITNNKYKDQDTLYDAAESILKGFVSGKNDPDTIKSGLNMLVSGVNGDTCQDFLEILCNEICKDENGDLYKEIDMLWKKRKIGFIHGEFEKSNPNYKEICSKIDHIVENIRLKEDHRVDNYSEISIINRAEEYAQKWNQNIFLNNFNKRDANAGVNIKLRDIYLEEQLPHYIWKTDGHMSDDLKELLYEYIADNNDKKCF